MPGGPQREGRMGIRHTDKGGTAITSGFRLAQTPVQERWPRLTEARPQVLDPGPGPDCVPTWMLATRLDTREGASEDLGAEA